jgi:hypothetical protein
MSIDLEHARDFVYQHGVLWERALFGHLFEDRPVEAVQRALLAYKNSDNGFGNAMEHDARCPDSHPLALEFLLTVLTRTGIEPGNLLDGTAHWVEMNREEDGALRNPAAFLAYPHAPWWNGGGQKMPDSIVGNLMTLGKATPSLVTSTRQWVQQNLTLEAIRANDWLFMSYHSYDYFFADDDFPAVERYREAVVETILRLAATMPENQTYTLFSFAPTPYSPVALAADEDLIERGLHTLESSQQEDGGWRDQHGLPQWYPWVTISNLLTLRAYGRI